MGDGAVVHAAGEALEVLAERALFWPATRTLFVADTHFGKEAAFRNGGIPVPDACPADLDRLARVVARTRAARLVVLGDLIHAADGLTDRVVDALAAWRRAHAALTVELVPGNHDRLPDGFLGDLGIDERGAEVQEGPFLLRHDPEPPEVALNGAYLLSGHVHPAVRLRGGRWQSLRLPCFLFGRQRAILPAFGSFTGTHRVRAGRGDRIFVIGEGRVFAL